MADIAIVYYSATGNTEKMADEIAKYTAQSNNPKLIEAANFDSNSVGDYEGFIFGCPASGSEELEDSTFLPMWDEVKANLGGKKVALFGSYGWGGGEWMENWKEDCASNSIEVLATAICNGEPDDEAFAQCKELASKF